LTRAGPPEAANPRARARAAGASAAAPELADRRTAGD
jgi:hypothetical protein